MSTTAPTNASIVSDSGTILAIVNGKPHSFAKDHPNYERVKVALKEKNFDEVERLANTSKVLQEYMESVPGGAAEVKHGQVYYNGKAVNNTLTQRILALMAEGFPFEPMLRFMENLMSNPFRHSVAELYKFLSNRNLPITEDGCFLAYKRVRTDYKDVYSGTIDNSIGQSPEMRPNEVDENWRQECSSGFHVGAIEYVSSYYNVAESRIMIVKVNPKDVVSVPEENSFTKCRTCKYTVVGEMQQELVRPLYQTTQNSFSPVDAPNSISQNHHDDDDEEEDDDDYPDFEDDDDDDDEYDDDEG